MGRTELCRNLLRKGVERAEVLNEAETTTNVELTKSHQGN